MSKLLEKQKDELNKFLKKQKKDTDLDDAIKKLDEKNKLLEKQEQDELNKILEKQKD